MNSDGRMRCDEKRRGIVATPRDHNATSLQSKSFKINCAEAVQRVPKGSEAPVVKEEFEELQLALMRFMAPAQG